MSIHFVGASALLLFGTTALASSADPVPTTQVSSKSEAVCVQRQAQEMRAKLTRPAAFLEKGVDATMFREVVEFLGQKGDLLIVIDRDAFKSDLQVDNIEEMPVSLPKLQGVSLSTVLYTLSRHVGGTYLVLPDHVLITTVQRARPDLWTNDSSSSEPVVNAEFSKQPLAEALQEISALTGINVVLDARVEEQAKSPVTATLSNVPMRTGVRLLADTADLECVTMKGALYVTTKENADRLRREEKPKGAPPAAGRAEKPKP